MTKKMVQCIGCGFKIGSLACPSCPFFENLKGFVEIARLYQRKYEAIKKRNIVFTENEFLAKVKELSEKGDKGKMIVWDDSGRKYAKSTEKREDNGNVDNV